MNFTEREAYHEAGHAVMAHLMGVSILCIKTKPKDSTTAAICLPGITDKLSVEQLALIKVAGNVAQSIQAGDIVEDYGCLDDMGPEGKHYSATEVASLWWQAHDRLAVGSH